jgi:hypothetical protein
LTEKIPISQRENNPVPLDEKVPETQYEKIFKPGMKKVLVSLDVKLVVFQHTKLRFREGPFLYITELKGLTKLNEK